MLSRGRKKSVDIVELAISILVIIPLADAYDTCDVSGRLTVTGRKPNFGNFNVVNKNRNLICSDTDIERTIM